MDAVKADGGDFYFLFRGDIGLPKGLLPLSPLARRLIWQGHTFEEAHLHCESRIDSIYIEANEDGLVSLQHTLMTFSEANHFLNPFVSTTSDLHLAFDYAGQNKPRQGYVSVFRLQKDRFTQFCKWLNISSTQKLNEFGVHGLILAEEVLFQVPLVVIDFERYSSPSISNNKNVLDFVKTYGTDKHRYRPVDPPVLRCPSCGSPLSPYLNKEVLNCDSKDIRIFKLPKINEHKLPIGQLHSKDGSVDWENFYSKTTKEQPLGFLAEHGMIARCIKCSCYVCDPKRIESRPLKIVSQWANGKHIFLKLRNDSDEPIVYVVLKVTYQENGKTRTQYQGINMILFSLLIMFDRDSIETRKATKSIDILWKTVLKKYGEQIKPLQGNAEKVYDFDLDVEPEKQPGFKIVINKVHFLSGNSWYLPEV